MGGSGGVYSPVRGGLSDATGHRGDVCRASAVRSCAAGAATAGGSDTQGAAAQANATVLGTSGDLQLSAASAAQTHTLVPAPPLVAAISAATSLSLAGNSVSATALAEYGIALPALGSVSVNALSEATVAPPDVSTILGLNPTIQAAFGADPAIFDVGGMGAGGAGLQRGQTVTDTASVTINAATLGQPGNLVLGLFNGQIDGGAADSATIILLVQENGGPTLLNETFTTLGQAFTSFNDSVAPLANAGIGDSGQVQIDVSLKIRTDITGDGFFGNLILGEAPSQAAGWERLPAEHHSFDPIYGLADLALK